VSNALEKAIDARSQPGPFGRIFSRAGIAGIVLTAGAIVAWQWGARVQAPPASAAKPAIPVTTAKVTTQDLAVWLSGIGTVTPLNAVDVKVRVDGQLQKITFREGQEVTAGQLLAKIDPRPYQTTLAQAEANRRRDLAQFTSARQEVARARKLASAGAGTSQSLDTLRAQAGALQATLDADQAIIDAAKLNLDFTDVTSPLAGRVGLRNADAGAIVHATDATGLVTVTQIVPIAVLFSLPQDELPAVMQAQRHGELTVAVDTRDGTQHIADGRLVFINSTVDTTNGQIQMKAEFTNTDRVLWPGEFVAARVRLRTDRGAAVVPSQAVQTGTTVNGVTEIISGLRTGQNVVISGQSRLAPGTLVKLSTPSAGSPS
jgi:multidrug efflux system membrane fusion protein